MSDATPRPPLGRTKTASEEDLTPPPGRLAPKGDDTGELFKRTGELEGRIKWLEDQVDWLTKINGWLRGRMETLLPETNNCPKCGRKWAKGARHLVCPICTQATGLS